MEEFKKLGLKSELLKVIEELKFEEPSEIQEKAIPFILEGKDLIGTSATGSGKTLVFAAGILDKVKRRKGVQALVLTPTRELAEQVSSALRKFSKNDDLTVLEIYGGVSINPQIEKIPRSEVIVGTPGRILDHLQRNTLKLNKIEILVLDEADRMVDMGFLPDVEQILKQCNKDRQTLLFSATNSPDTDYMADKYMKNPKYVSVKSYVDPSKLKHSFYDVPSHLKFSLLLYLLKKDVSGLVMVFCNTRRNTEIITKNLVRFKLHAMAIHGGLTQSMRNSIIEKFHKNKLDILVCTDVAARGLDIKGVSHIYNYDTPASSNDYIHRVGRTARAGKEGEAISLVSKRDYDNFRTVKSDQSLKIPEKELPEFPAVAAHFSDKHDKYSRDSRGGSRGRDSRGGSDRHRSGGRDSRGGSRDRPSYGGSRDRPSYGGRDRPSYGSNRSGGSRNDSRGSSRPRSEGHISDRPRTGGYGSDNRSRDRPSYGGSRTGGREGSSRPRSGGYNRSGSSDNSSRDRPRHGDHRRPERRGESSRSSHGGRRDSRTNRPKKRNYVRR